MRNVRESQKEFKAFLEVLGYIMSFHEGSGVSLKFKGNLRKPQMSVMSSFMAFRVVSKSLGRLQFCLSESYWDLRGFLEGSRRFGTVRTDSGGFQRASVELKESLQESQVVF